MYQVLWPLGKKSVEVIRPSQRLNTLAGKTICELWNWSFRGDEIFPMLEQELAKRYPGSKFVSYKAFGPTHGAEEATVLAALPDKLKQNRCDAVISGVGC